MKKQNRKQGFTLVELLVVIAILAILATVSIVGYTAFIKKAHESNALAEANQIKEVIRAELIAGEDFVISAVPDETNSTTTTTLIRRDSDQYKVMTTTDNENYTAVAGGTDLSTNFAELNDGDLKDLFADGNKIIVGSDGLSLIYQDGENQIYVEIDLNADTAKLIEASAVPATPVEPAPAPAPETPAA